MESDDSRHNTTGGSLPKQRNKHDNHALIASKEYNLHQWVNRNELAEKIMAIVQHVLVTTELVTVMLLLQQLISSIIWAYLPAEINPQLQDFFILNFATLSVRTHA